MVDRVQQAIKSLHYEPSLAAGSLRRSGHRTQALGLLVGDVANPFSGSVHRAVEDAAGQRNFAVFTSSLDDDAERERMIVSEFLRRRVDGLIMTTAAPSQSYLHHEKERGTPLVFIDRPPNGIDADTIISDNVGGAVLATEHLIMAGHRRIAFLGDRQEIFTARERQRGFLQAMRQAGLTVQGWQVINGLSDATHAYRAVRMLLDKDESPTAILSGQNIITYGVLRALRDCGVQATTALIGFDDFPMAELLDPGITVIAQNPRGIGRIAVERVFAGLDGIWTRAITTVVPTTLIARGSGELRPQD
jgi:LacI family transcriptional regulator